MKAAVVVPVFNHARTVGRVVEEVRAVMAGMVDVGELIVVDDGCTDGSSEVIGGMAGVTGLRHRRNRGKGRALLTGLEYARGKGYSHVLTIDADGQHCAGDLAGIWEAARGNPDDLVIGCRDMEASGNVPARSKKGRDAARFWLRVQTGQEIPDSQCGLRAYPLSHVLGASYRFWRFDFETEVLARMAWAGLVIRSVPVRCIYFAGNERVSHFRPVVDTLRGVRVNVFLVARRLAPVPLKRLVGKEGAAVQFGKWWKWETWREAVKEAVREGSTNSELATAFAVGIFIGLTPFYFLHSLIAIYIARRMHLNMVAALIGSQISIPPLVPVWVMLNTMVGKWVTGGGAGNAVAGWLMGDFVVALAMAAVGLFVARAVLACVRVERVST
ncbi:MAG: DUF2062 domain-containing protein [Phycisphaerae bacterium]